VTSSPTTSWSWANGKYHGVIWLWSTVSSIGVGAGKFLGVRRSFAQISPKLARKVFVRQTFHDVKLRQEEHKKVFNLCHRAVFLKKKKVKFRRLSFRLIWKCRNICARIFWDFRWIFDKSKLLEVRLHPQLLHHCSFRYYILRNHPHSVNCDKHMLHLSLNLCDICLTFWFYGQVNFYPTSAQNFAKAIYVLRSFN